MPSPECAAEVVGDIGRATDFPSVAATPACEALGGMASCFALSNISVSGLFVCCTGLSSSTREDGDAGEGGRGGSDERPSVASSDELAGVLIAGRYPDVDEVPWLPLRVGGACSESGDSALECSFGREVSSSPAGSTRVGSLML